MASYLIDLGVDTLLFTGCTTSGCVRASVADAFSYNFRALVVEEGCYDRGYTSHLVNLFDMNAKYADVISIENSRSDAELLEVFRDFKYDKEIGPGVYDIHSPRVPPAEEMTERLRQATAVLPPALVWVNPDCGLKTRRDEEVRPALEHLVAAAKAMRA